MNSKACIYTYTCTGHVRDFCKIRRLLVIPFFPLNKIEIDVFGKRFRFPDSVNNFF